MVERTPLPLSPPPQATFRLLLLAAPLRRFCPPLSVLPPLPPPLGRAGRTPSYHLTFPFPQARVERRVEKTPALHLLSLRFLRTRTETRVAREVMLRQPPLPSPSLLPLPQGMEKRMPRTPLFHLLPHSRARPQLREVMAREENKTRGA